MSIQYTHYIPNFFYLFLVSFYHFNKCFYSNFAPMCIAGYKLRLYEEVRLLEARRGKKGKKYEEIRPYVATWGLDVATWGLDVVAW